MAGSSTVIQYRTAPRCKFCQSPHRSEIDALLERRAKGETDAAGVRINLNKVLEMIAELGVQNPTADNIKSHWGSNEAKAHSYFTSEAAKEKSEKDDAEEIAARKKLVTDILGEDYFKNPRPVTADEYLELTRAVATYEMTRKLVAGEKIAVTPDHGLKSVDAATRRNANEATNDLLRGLGVAMTGVFVQKAVEADKSLRELEEQVPVEVEYEVVE